MSVSKHQLLICVEAVDSEDRAYGFFTEWLQELEDQGIRATVVCLRRGKVPVYREHRIIALPSHGRFTSLRRAWALWRISWQERKTYEAVFVRGAAVFVVATGLLWRGLGKRVVFWYAHYTGNQLLEPAAMLANRVITSVPEACRIRSKKPIPIGQSVPTERFRIPADKTYNGYRGIMLGRVSTSKRVRVAVRSFLELDTPQGSELVIIGRDVDQSETTAVRAILSNTDYVHWNKAGVPYEELPRLLPTFDFMINFYPGSLDKSILEAMACGVIPFMATDAAERLLPQDLHWLITRNGADLKEAFERFRALTSEERKTLAERLRKLVVERHSLSGQVRALIEIAGV